VASLPRGRGLLLKKLVFITQVVDPSDPNLGATAAKIAALARRVDEVVVICDRGTDEVLPANCRVRTFGSSRRWRRAFRYVTAVVEEMREPPAAVIAHMIPLYAVVAAPFVRTRGARLMLWYTHWKAHAVLRLAVLVSTDLLSVDDHSFPVRSHKMHAIGHGIDLSEFPCAPPAPSPQTTLRVLALGRYSRAKRIDELIEGVRLARERGVDAVFAAYGTTGTPELEACKQELEAVARRFDWATIGDPVARTDVSAAYAAADVVASDFDSPDKVVFEACASCRPVLASDASFGSLFAGIDPPLAFERGRPETFAGRLEALAALDGEARYAIGKELRERVRKHHSVDTWADAILRLADAT
jgi:glycosyltransferase involved in cell wall biosynthesis